MPGDQADKSVHIPYRTAIIMVPARIHSNPNAAFFVSFSLNTTHENAMVTRMLSLSIGTTTLAGPSCRAR